MAYKSTRPKGEDPNAESRLKPPSTAPVMPPAAPYVQNPAGGAPKAKPGTPSLVGPGGTMPTPAPTVNPAGPPAVVGPGGTQYPQTPTSKLASPFTPPTPITQPWQRQPAPAPAAPSIAPSLWTLKDVAAAEPEVTKQIQDLLWSRYQSASEQERGGVFWQGVKQNPQLAAASFVRRMLDNMRVANDLMNGATPPTLNAAASATSANSETRQWLDWVRGNRRSMPRRVI